MKPVSKTNPLSVVSSAKAAPEPCHEGNVEVYRCGNLVLHGGGLLHGAVEEVGWLVINLVPGSPEFGWAPFVACQNVSLPRLEPWLNPKCIHLPITDGGVPAFPPSFWDALVDDLLDLAAEVAPEEYHVLVVCQGGHGRTGTVLAILVGLLAEELPDDDPIAYVRAHYCDQAVETRTQARYVQQMTGRDFDADHVSLPTRAVWMPPSPVGGVPTRIDGMYDGDEWWDNGDLTGSRKKRWVAPWSGRKEDDF